MPRSGALASMRSWRVVRRGRGRSAATHKTAGNALAAAARTHFAPLLERRHIGLTLQIDEGQEVYDAKVGNLHPLFATKD
mgnify:CR=1 FL=1